MGKTKWGKGTKLMAVANRSGFPLAIYMASASPHEVTLVQAILAQVLTREGPEQRNWSGAMNQFAILFEGRVPIAGLSSDSLTQNPV